MLGKTKNPTYKNKKIFNSQPILHNLRQLSGFFLVRQPKPQLALIHKHTILILLIEEEPIANIGLQVNLSEINNLKVESVDFSQCIAYFVWYYLHCEL